MQMKFKELDWNGMFKKAWWQSEPLKETLLRVGCIQGPTSTRYSNRTLIFLYYSNPTRNFLKNDRVASSMYTWHLRKIAARLTIFYCPWYKTFPFWQKFDQRSSWKFCHLLLTIIMTMVMMTIISAIMIITKYSLSTIDFATRYSTRYSDVFAATLLEPYSK